MVNFPLTVLSHICIHINKHLPSAKHGQDLGIKEKKSVLVLKEPTVYPSLTYTTVGFWFKKMNWTLISLVLSWKSNGKKVQKYKSQAKDTNGKWHNKYKISTISDREQIGKNWLVTQIQGYYNLKYVLEMVPTQDGEDLQDQTPEISDPIKCQSLKKKKSGKKGTNWRSELWNSWWTLFPIPPRKKSLHAKYQFQQTWMNKGIPEQSPLPSGIWVLQV